jgi:AmmeMemoRadiSam system protein B
VEAFPIPQENGPGIGLRDRSGLSDAVLSVSEPALALISLLNGERTCDQIRQEFMSCFGGTLPVETLNTLLEKLEEAKFLEGPAFETYYESLAAEYRQSGVRLMRQPAALGLNTEAGRMFDGILAEAIVPRPSRPIVGLIAPHLDYPRGRPCYAEAYAALRTRTVPARVVILGTNHFGRSRSVVATANDFVTPLGTTLTDTDFLTRLESRCGSLRTFELDHSREHSVELQVAWLQHLFGATSFRMLAVLCPDPCGPTGTAPGHGHGVDLRVFAEELGALVAEDGAETLLVAGADLSHVGAAFGDQRILDDAFLDEVRRRDRKALSFLEVGDPDGYRRAVACEDNPTRICSAGCMFALATALPGRPASVLRYHQALDRANHTCVTCAALAFT